MSPFKFNHMYWDCECEQNYIHHKNSGNFCPLCGAHEKDQPSSISSEIKYNYTHESDIHIQKREYAIL